MSEPVVHGRADPAELLARLQAWTRTLQGLGIKEASIPGLDPRPAGSVQRRWVLTDEELIYPGPITIDLPEDAATWLEWAGDGCDSPAMADMMLDGEHAGRYHTGARWMTLGPPPTEVPTQIDAIALIGNYDEGCVGVVVDQDSEWFGYAIVSHITKPPCFWGRYMFLPSLLSVVDCWELALRDGHYRRAYESMIPTGGAYGLYLPAALHAPPEPLKHTD